MDPPSAVPVVPLVLCERSLMIRRSPPSLETLNLDVFRMILLELERERFALQRLASTSRTLRALTSPVLFSRCQYWPALEIPLAIRPFVRRLQYHMQCQVPTTIERLKAALGHVPSLVAIHFVGSGNIPWDALKVCFDNPRITTITLGPYIEFAERKQDPQDASPPPPAPITISEFTYEAPFWRDVLELARGRYNVVRDLQAVRTRECAGLSEVLPRMHKSLKRLTLPMEITPLSSMARLSWPTLQALSIHGRYQDASQIQRLPDLLSALPTLHTLSVQAPPFSQSGRLPILGRHGSPREVLCGLQSLTVAYPDPEDSIFSIDTTHLAQLSIRDSPRYYERRGVKRLYGWSWDTPVLSARECLSILSHMDMPKLRSLELVYLVDAADDDEELLKYIISTYVGLTHLELHRYRVDSNQDVDHRHISELLSGLKSLRTVHLNLDFAKDHGAYCADEAQRCAWFPILRAEYGPQIVDIMKACPDLEYVGLLYHHTTAAIWLEFHPPRCAEPRFVLSTNAAHRDTESIPIRWHSGVPSAATNFTP